MKPTNHPHPPTRRAVLTGVAFALALGSLLAGCSSGGSTPTEPLALDEPISTSSPVQEAGQGVAALAQFQGRVTAINTSTRTLTLHNGSRVRIRQSTVFDPEGDLFSFGDIVGSFNAGFIVSVEGDGNFRPDGTIVATQIKAEDNN